MTITLILDQSTTTCGFAVLSDEEYTLTSAGIIRGKLLRHGVITTSRKADLVDRLTVMKTDIKTLIEAYTPNEMVIEQVNYAGRANAKILAAIDDVCKRACKTAGIPLYKQHPSTVKKTATGDGHAEKHEVQAAVSRIWNLSKLDILDDNHADALAGAYTWIHTAQEMRNKEAK